MFRYVREDILNIYDISAKSKRVHEEKEIDNRSAAIEKIDSHPFAHCYFSVVTHCSYLCIS